jgi:hypothetical protein
LHVKDVPIADLDAAERLACGAATLNIFRYVRRWLYDVSRYEKVPVKTARGIPSTNMPDEWVALLEKFGVTVEISREEVRGHVLMFTVYEEAKDRDRPIKYTRDANNALGKETVMRLRFPTKQEICDLVHHGECFIALDFSSFYDQFAYSPEVGARFCFRHGDKYYRLARLAMGERHACEVAQGLTDLLLDFGPKCKTASIIDGVIFCGSREDVIRDATTFVERVRAIGAKLNEDVSDIAALVQTAGVWGGIALDFARKTSCLASKTVDKIERSWRFRETWTWRNFQAHVGLLFWSWGLIDAQLSEFFPLLRFIGEADSMLTQHDDLWDSRAFIAATAWAPLERWTMTALRNAPRVVPRVQAPEWLVATDASEYGWGVVAVHNETGVVRTHGARWQFAFAQHFASKLGTSTFTEPQGVVNALCWLLDPKTPARVRILTDNSATQAVFQRGFSSRSYHMNECVKRLHRIFGEEFQFDFGWMPGEINPADGLSRGVIASGEVARDSLSADELRRIAGSATLPSKDSWLR